LSERKKISWIFQRHQQHWKLQKQTQFRYFGRERRFGEFSLVFGWKVIEFAVLNEWNWTFKRFWGDSVDDLDVIQWLLINVLGYRLIKRTKDKLINGRVKIKTRRSLRVQWFFMVNFVDWGLLERRKEIENMEFAAGLYSKQTMQKFSLAASFVTYRRLIVLSTEDTE
jgi:hypothetical protein